MKKSILFAVKNMNIGGVEKSLISLLNALEPSEYDVDLLLLESNGGFLESVPPWVRIIAWNDYQSIRDEVNLPPVSVIKNLFLQKRIGRAIRLGIGFLKYKISKNIICYYKSVFRGLSIVGLKEHYDTAVSYTSLISYLSYTVLNYVNADRYLGWIHFDVSKLVLEKKSIRKLHENMSKIYVVSNNGRTVFCNMFPEFSDKCFVKYNVLDKKAIIERSMMPIDFSFEDDKVIIVTVSRLSYEKGVDLAVEAAKILKRQFERFRWYIIGGGNEYENLSAKIVSEELEDNVLLLGEIDNPLPYVKMADIYVQPSRMEGYCTTTNEAKVLHKPVVVTEVNGMREQFVENETALFVPREDPNELAGAIYQLCISPEERKRMSDNIDKYGFVEDKDDLDSIFA